MSAALPSLLILTGPTASGKSALALRLAERLGLGIVGADSRQVYAGLEVATAAPSADDRTRVPHALVGHVPMHEDYSAGRFVRECRAVLNLDISRPRAKGDDAWLLCGGSGFYLRALLNPVSPLLRADPQLRRQLRQQHAALDNEALRQELLARDPEAGWIPAADRAKLERYLEICHATGLPASRAQRDLSLPRPVRPLLVVLDPSLDWLEARILQRSRLMLATGMVEEVAAALQAGVPRRGNALRSVGVAEVEALLAGELDPETCAAAISLRTRQLAKRQLTWQRGLAARETVLSLPADWPVERLADQVVRAWTEHLKEAACPS